MFIYFFFFNIDSNVKIIEFLNFKLDINNNALISLFFSNLISYNFVDINSRYIN